MSARAGLALLRSVRDAIATDEGKRLAREIVRVISDTTDDTSADSYEARLVARAFAKSKPKRKQL